MAVNKIVYGSYTFNDDELISVTLNLEEAPVQSALAADQLVFKVRSSASGKKKIYDTFLDWVKIIGNKGLVVQGGNLLTYTYGDPVYYYRDNVLFGKFYITQVDRLGASIFKLTCTSAIGLLIKQAHSGGVYSQTPAGDLIADILSGTGLTYAVDSDVAETVVEGWLPYSNKRDNLKNVLFATGASALKNSDGSLKFTYNKADEYKEIPDSRIYIGGQNERTPAATRIVVVEHQYYEAAGAASEVVHEQANVAANHRTVVFSEPVVPTSITADNTITIHSSGANFVNFSGLGQISAIKYAHASTELSQNLSVSGEKREVSVRDATLISALNSNNVLDRLIGYYSEAESSVCDIVVEDEKPGDFVTYTDPFGEERNGFVESMDITVSATNKARSRIRADWLPGPFGNNYTHCVVLQGIGEWQSTPVDGYSRIRVIVIGAGGGGKGGGAGYRASYFGSTMSGWQRTFPDHYSEGGVPGTPGTPGKVFVKDFKLPGVVSVRYGTGTAGPGGPGGQTEGEAGSDGTAGGESIARLVGSGFNQISCSSANGVLIPGGWLNVLTGITYAKEGKAGYPAGKGGTVDEDGNYVDAEDITIDGVTYHGGQTGSQYDWTGYNPSGTDLYQKGGFGSGPAYGSDGSDGTNGNMQARNHGNFVTGKINTIIEGTDGIGADGADALPNPDATVPGSAGDGGNAGGGAGGGGFWRGYDYGDYGDEMYYGEGQGGNPGKGSKGSDGAGGVVIIMY